MVQVLGFDEPVVWSYHAQLYVRKRLNEISGKLYNPEKKVRPDDQKTLSEIEESVFKYRDLWAGMYKFDLSAPPSDDILHARFRAKFWGANVITYRPSIQYILDLSYRRAHPEEYPGYHPDMVQDVSFKIVLDNACKGLGALKHSTQAFHGLHDKRFIITNPFGTAHAYVISFRSCFESVLIMLQTMGQSRHTGRCLSRPFSRTIPRRARTANAFRKNDQIFRSSSTRNQQFSSGLENSERLAGTLTTTASNTLHSIERLFVWLDVEWTYTATRIRAEPVCEHTDRYGRPDAYGT